MMEIKKYYDDNGYYLPIDAVNEIKIDRASEKIFKLYQNPPKISIILGIYRLIY